MKLANGIISRKVIKYLVVNIIINMLWFIYNALIIISPGFLFYFMYLYLSVLEYKICIYGVYCMHFIEYIYTYT